MKSPAPDSDAFDKLLDTYVQELILMSDEQALGGVDPIVMEKEGMDLLLQARDKAGRRRLDIARAKLATQKSSPVNRDTMQAVTPQEARRFLAQVANDSLYTMAARDLKEMPDEEALRLYAQIKKLENQQSQSGDEE